LSFESILSSGALAVVVVSSFFTFNSALILHLASIKGRSEYSVVMSTDIGWAGAGGGVELAAVDVVSFSRPWLFVSVKTLSSPV
jgi:hypothetical protein